MRCSSCNSAINKKADFCSNCGLACKKICENCDLIFPENANFCMSCGSKLALFSSDKTEDRTQKKNEESIEIAIDEDKSKSSSYPSSFSYDKEKNTEKSEKTSEIPDAGTVEDIDESSLRIEEVTDDDDDTSDPEKSEDNETEEIMEPEIINMENGESRDIEEGEIVEDVPVDTETIELETIEPEEPEPEEPEPEEPEPKEPEPEEPEPEKPEPEEPEPEKPEPEEPEPEKPEPEEPEPEEPEPEEPEPEEPEPETTNDDNEIIAPAHPEIKQHSFSENFSLDKLCSSIETTSYKSEILPVFKAIEKKVKKHEGGMWFLKESNGSGSQFFIEKIKKAAPMQSGVKVIVSEANLHEFDYILFINLIKELLSLNSEGENTIKSKIRRFFGEAVENKLDIITAILALNFQPLKHRLPRNEIQYLISYMLYAAARENPVIWVIHNAGHINTRATKLFANLKKSLRHIPLEIIFVTEEDSRILTISEKDETCFFPGMDKNEITNILAEHLNTRRLPADIEKKLKTFGNNILFAIHFIEFLKDQGLIFEMRDTWRFSKLPENLEYPANIDSLVMLRLELLEKKTADVLKKLVLLNLNPIPIPLIKLSSIDETTLSALTKKHFIIRDGDFYTFTSNTVLNILRKNVKLEGDNTHFFRDIVANLSKLRSPVFRVNKHWLLLKFIILGSIKDQKLNPFLFTAAAYMEKIGFLEMSQRIYQAILGNLEKSASYENLKLLIDFKNSKIMKQIEPEWAKIFWNKLQKTASKKRFRQLDLYARTQILLIDDKNLEIDKLGALIKKLHQFGCYEEELTAIDQTVEKLLEKGNLSVAEKFAKRAVCLIEKEKENTRLISILRCRFACSLAEIKIMLGAYAEARSILDKLSESNINSNTFLSSRRSYLSGQLNFLTGKNWEKEIKEGFFKSLKGLDFKMIKKYFEFFNKNHLTKEEWVKPYNHFYFILDFHPD